MLCAATAKSSRFARTGWFWKVFLVVAAFAAVLVGWSSSADAQLVLEWRPTGVSTEWSLNPLAPNWWNGTTQQRWDNGAQNTEAVFANPAYPTAVLSDLFGNVVAGKLTFRTPGVTVNATGAAWLFLNGGIDVTAVGPLPGTTTVAAPVTLWAGLTTPSVWNVTDASQTLIVGGTGAPIDLSGKDLSLTGDGSILINGGVTTWSTGLTTISASGAGVKQFNSVIDNGINMLRFNVATGATLRVNGDPISGLGIIGLGSIEKKGGGTLVLAGINQLGWGTFTLDSGTVLVGHNDSLGGFGGPAIEFAGGILGATGPAEVVIQNAWQVRDLTGLGAWAPIRLGGNRRLVLNDWSAKYFDNQTIDVTDPQGEAVIASPITMNAGKTLTLTGPGRLVLEGDITVDSGVVIRADGAGRYTLAGTINTWGARGQIAFTPGGGSTLVLTRDNTGALTGTVTVPTGSTLVLGHRDALGGAGGATLNMAGGAIGSIGTLVYPHSWTLATGSTLRFAEGDITLQKASHAFGAGEAIEAMVAGGTGTLAVPTVTVAGPLALRGPGNVILGTSGGTLSVVAPGTSYQFDVSGGGKKVIASNLTSPRPLSVTGGGTLVLRGSSAATSTTVTNAALGIAHESGLGIGKLTLNNGTLSVGFAEPGLLGRYWAAVPQNVGNQNPDFATLAALNSAAFMGVTPNHTAPTTWGLNFTGPSAGFIFQGEGWAGPADNYIARFDGYLWIPTSGTYTFGTTSDDCSVMFLNNEDTPLVMNNYYQGPTRRTSAPTFLAAGYYPVTFAFCEAGGGAYFTADSNITGALAVLNNEYLFRSVPERLSRFAHANDVDVFGSSAIDMTAGFPNVTYTLGRLTMADGATLAVPGMTTRILEFSTGTTLPAGGSVTFDNVAQVKLGAVTGAVGNLTKAGVGTLEWTGTLRAKNIMYRAGRLSGDINLIGTSADPSTFSYAAGPATGELTGQLDLNNHVANFVVNRGSAAVDLKLSGKVTNGGIAMSGGGIMELASTDNDYALGTTISGTNSTLVLSGSIGTGALVLNDGTRLVMSGPQPWVAGLREIRLPQGTGWNTGGNRLFPEPTALNSQVTLGVRAGQFNAVTNPPQPYPNPNWSDNTTFVYIGKFYDADGFFAFAENIDDNVAIWIDGVLRLENTTWNVPTTTGSSTNNAYGGTTYFGMGPAGDGWHDIEIRMFNGGGGAGAVSGNGWTTTFGFGLTQDPAYFTSNQGTDYFAPVDPGDMSLFKALGFPVPFVASNPVAMNGSVEVDLGRYAMGVTASFGPLTRSADGGTLTVSGANRTLAFSGTRLVGSGDVILAATGNLDLGAIDPASSSINLLRKTGDGTVRFTTGTINANTLVADRGLLTYSGTISAGSVVGERGRIAGGTLNAGLITLKSESITGTINLTGASPRVVFPTDAWGDARIAGTLNLNRPSGTDRVEFAVARRDAGFTPVPVPPLSSMDIGGPGLPGSYSFDGITHTVRGGGADIWGTADQFHFAYMPFSFDLDVRVDVLSLEQQDPWSKAGIMMRETLTAGSRYEYVMVAPPGGTNIICQQWRTSTGGSAAWPGSGVTGSAPVSLRIVRSGNTFVTYYKPIGAPSWIPLYSNTNAMSTDYYVGLAVTSHNNAAISTATFQNLEMGIPVPGVGVLTVDAATLAGSIRKTGDGMLVLTNAANQHTDTVVEAGTLRVFGPTGALGTGTLTLKPGTTLDLGGGMTPGLREIRLPQGTAWDTGAGRLFPVPDATNSQIGLGVRAGQFSTVTNPPQPYPNPNWSDNTTFVYIGQFYDADGFFAFAENIDDNVAIWIDGQLRLVNTGWNTPTTTGSTSNNAFGGTTYFGMGPAGDGWHDIEIRMYNGGGGAGPVAGNGWTSTFGFGLTQDPTKFTSNQGVDYFRPVDPGDASLFRVPIWNTNTIAGTNPVTMEGNVTIDLRTYQPTAASFGQLTRAADGSALTILGAASKSITFSGTRLTGGGATGFVGTAGIGLGALVPGENTVTTLDKLTSGALTFSGTLRANRVNMLGGQLGASGGTLQMYGTSPAINYLSTATSAASVAAAVDVGSQTVTIDVPRVMTTVGEPDVRLSGGVIGTSSGALRKTGSGILALTAPGTYGGGTDVTAGQLQLTVPGGGGTGAITLRDGTSLRLGEVLPPAGLAQGFIPGPASPGFDSTTPNPRNAGITLQPFAGNRSDAGSPGGWGSVAEGNFGTWAGIDNRIYIYTGWIYLGSNTTVSFAADIDDRAWATIDGKPTPDAVWQYGTGIIDVGLGPYGDGWHYFELRFGEYGGGAGPTQTRNGFVANVFGVGYASPGVTGNTAFLLKPIVDPGDGSLLRVDYPSPAARNPFIGNNPLVVHGNAEVLLPGLPGSVSTLGALTRYADGGTLTVTGADRALLFASSTLPSGGELRFAGNAHVGLGQVNLGGPAVTAAKSGSGALVFNYNAAPSNLAGLTVNVRSGSAVAGVGGGAGRYDPFGGLALNMEDNTAIAIISEAPGSPAFRPVINNILGNLLIQQRAMYGNFTDTLDVANLTTIALAPGRVLNLESTGGTLVLADNLQADLVVKTGVGTVRYGGAQLGGALRIDRGTLQLGADERIADTVPVVVNARGTLDLNNFTETLASLRVNTNGTVLVGAGTLRPATLQMTGGEIRMGATGRLSLSGTGVQLLAGGNRAMIVGGQAVTGTDYVFDVANGPNVIDLWVSSELATPTAAVIKNGEGTLILNGRNSFGGGVRVNAGEVKVTRNEALGATGATVLLGQGAVFGAVTSVDTPMANLSVGATDGWHKHVVVAADRTIRLDTAGGATYGIIDVDRDWGYPLAWGGAQLNFYGRLQNNNVATAPAGTMVKTGTGLLALRNTAAYGNRIASLEIREGAVSLHHQLALGVANPDIGVHRDGFLIIRDAVDVDLSNVRVTGYGHRWASGLPWWYTESWWWTTGHLRIDSNVGGSTAFVAPAAPITGILEFGADQGTTNTTATFRMGNQSILHVNRNAMFPRYEVVRGEMWVSVDGAARTWDTSRVISGAGGIIRSGDLTQSWTIQAAQTYLGKTYINTNPGVATFVQGSAASMRTSEVVLMQGRLLSDDSTTDFVGSSRFLGNDGTFTPGAADDFVMRIYNGEYRYKGLGATATSDEVSRVELWGAAIITSERVADLGTPTLTIHDLLRRPSGVVYFDGIRTGGTVDPILGSAATGQPTILIGAGSTHRLGSNVTPWAYVYNTFFTNNIQWAVYGANGVIAADRVTGFYPTAWPANTGMPILPLPNINQALAFTHSDATTPWINSLRLTAAGTLTLQSDLLIKTGGILLSGTGASTIAGDTPTRMLFANDFDPSTGDFGDPVELFISNNQSLDLNVAINAFGLTKSGAGALTLRPFAATNFGGGALNFLGGVGATAAVNALEIHLLTPQSIFGAGEINLSGVTLRPRSNSTGANTQVLWGNDVNVLYDSTIRPRNVDANDHVRHLFGNLTAEYATRVWFDRENNHTWSFRDVTLKGANFVDVNFTSNFAGQFGYQMGVPYTVTKGGPVWMNIRYGVTEWGSLRWAGGVHADDRRWTLAGESGSTGQMHLMAPAAAGYTANVEVIQGALFLRADGALGTGSTVTVVAPGRLDFTVDQTGANMPTVYLGEFAAIGGDVLTADHYGVGAGKINLPRENVVFVQRSDGSDPAVPAGRSGLDWLGLGPTRMAAGQKTTIDAAGPFRGVAIGSNWSITNPFMVSGFTISGDFESTGGDLNFYMVGGRSDSMFQPANPTAVQRLDSATGVINILGPAEIRWGSAGDNSPAGNFHTINRIGDSATQNSFLMVLYNGMNMIRPGVTVNIVSGRFTYQDHDTASRWGVADGAVVNIGTNASLFLQSTTASRRPETGTFNVASDGIVWMRRLDKMMGGATFNLSVGTRMVLASDTAYSGGQLVTPAVFANQGEKLDYFIVSSDENDIFLTADGSPAILLGEGRRVTTSWGTDGRMGLNATTYGHGIGWAPGATRILLTAPSGRTFFMYDPVTVPGGKVLQIGSEYAYPVLEGRDSFHTRFLPHDGAVQLNILNLHSGGAIDIRAGTLRFMEWTTTGSPFVLNENLVLNYDRPLDWEGGTWPRLDIRVGRAGAGTAGLLSGTGKIIVGQGYNVALMVDEVASGVTGLFNNCSFPIEVLGAGETRYGGSPQVTAVLRGIRGTDSTNWSSIARFSNVRMRDGAILLMTGDDHIRTLVDLLMLGDGRLYAGRGDLDANQYVMRLGDVRTEPGDTSTRTLIIGRRAGENHMDLIGNVAANVNLRIESSATVRLTTGTLFPGTHGTAAPFSTFTANGQTITLVGSGATHIGQWISTTAWVDIYPRATFDHTSTTAGTLMIYTGARGTAGLTGDTVIDLANSRTVMGYVEEVASGTQFVNNIGALIRLGPGAAGILRNERVNDLALDGYVRFTNVQLAQGASLRLQHSNSSLLVDIPRLLGDATVWSNDNGVVQFVGNIASDVPGRVLTVGGTQSLRLVGTVTDADLRVTSTATTFLQSLGAPINLSFNLNGRTITHTAGTLQLAVNPGAGTIVGTAGTIQGNAHAPLTTIQLNSGSTLTVNAANRQVGTLVFNGGTFTRAAGQSVLVQRALGGVGMVDLTGAGEQNINFAVGSGLAPGVGDATGTLTLQQSITTIVALPDSAVYYWKLGDTGNDLVNINGGLTLPGTVPPAPPGATNPTLRVIPVGLGDTVLPSYTIMTWTGMPTQFDPQPVSWTVDVSTPSPFVRWNAGAGSWDVAANWLQNRYTGGTVNYYEANGTPGVGADMGGSLRLEGLTVGTVPSPTIGSSSRVIIAPTGGGADVAGPGADLTIRSLQIGDGVGVNALTLAAGRTLTVSEAVDLRAASRLDVRGGLRAPTVGSAGTLSFASGSTGTLATLNVTGGTTTMASGVNATITTLNVSGGSAGIDAGTILTGNVSGGALSLGASMTTLNVSGGSASVGSAGRVTTGNVSGTGAMSVAGSMTTLNVSAGSATVAGGGRVATANVSGSGLLSVAGEVGVLRATGGQITAAGGVVDVGSATAAALVNAGANQLTVRSGMTLPDLAITSTAPFRLGGTLIGASPADPRNVVLTGGVVTMKRDPHTTGLVGYWNFDQGGGSLLAANAVPGGVVGVLTNMTGNEWTAANIPGRGGLGNALRFDGMNDMVIMGALGFTGTAPRTIAGWAKWDGSTAGGQWTQLFGFTPDVGATGTFFDMEVETSTPRRYALHFHGQDNRERNIDLDTWHYWTASFDPGAPAGQRWRLYCDGVLVLQGDPTVTMSIGDLFRVGGRPDQGGYLRGMVDEVRVYNRMLTDAEVRALYEYDGTLPSLSLPETRLVVQGTSTAAIGASGTATFGALEVGSGVVTLSGPAEVIFNSLKTVGSGGVSGRVSRIRGNVEWGAGSTLELVAGTMRFELPGGSTVTAGSNAKVVVAAGAALELAGAVAGLAGTGNYVAVENNSAAPGLVVEAGITQSVGRITGTGVTTIQDGATLSASAVTQSTVNVGAGAKLVLRGGATAEALAVNLGGGEFGPAQVPEPSTIALLGMAGLAAAGWLWRRRRG